ncbi:MAG: VanZ family protein [Dehalobacterium sp.]
MNNCKKNKKIKIIVSWTAVILWMLLIFSLSSDPSEQSDDLSRGIVKIIVETIEKVAPGVHFDMDSFNHIIRKSAHFVAYLVLGVLVLNANRRSGVLGFKGFILTMLICIIYASSDEVHQMFVPGRGPGIWDVFIDSAGALAGAGLYLTVEKRIISLFRVPGTDLLTY